MRPAGRRFVLLLLLSLAGCPKRVMVNGQEMPAHRADELAQVELVEVRRQAAALPPGPGAERLLAFAARSIAAGSKMFLPSKMTAFFRPGQ